MYHHSRITHRYSGSDGALRILHQYTDAVRTDTCRGHCVDDAIVVVENSTRLLDTGQYSARQAVTQAMGEITGPIVGVVLVLLAVFIPTMLVSGISGQLYKQFALTIAASTVLSGFNSLTLTPALCALILQPTKPAQSPLFRGFNFVYDKTQGIYDKPWVGCSGVLLLHCCLMPGLQHSL